MGLGLNRCTGSFFVSAQIGNSWTGPLRLIRISMSGFYRRPIRIGRPRLEIIDHAEGFRLMFAKAASQIAAAALDPKVPDERNVGIGVRRGSRSRV